jgi:hypothetical protein
MRIQEAMPVFGAAWPRCHVSWSKMRFGARFRRPRDVIHIGSDFDYVHDIVERSEQHQRGHEGQPDPEAEFLGATAQGPAL